MNCSDAIKMYAANTMTKILCVRSVSHFIRVAPLPRVNENWHRGVRMFRRL
jgi:hypothetical protein